MWTDDIYKMELHDLIKVDAKKSTIWITRVPGGWIYSTFGATGKAISTSFVTFNNEFQNGK